MSEISEELLARYVDGELDADEVRRVEAHQLAGLAALDQMRLDAPHLVGIELAVDVARQQLLGDLAHRSASAPRSLLRSCWRPRNSSDPTCPRPTPSWSAIAW